MTRRFAGLSSPRRTRDGSPARLAPRPGATGPSFGALGRHSERGRRCAGPIGAARGSRRAGCGRPGPAGEDGPAGAASAPAARRRLGGGAAFGSGLRPLRPRPPCARPRPALPSRPDARQFFLAHHVARRLDPFAQRHTGAHDSGHVLQPRTSPARPAAAACAAPEACCLGPGASGRSAASGAALRSGCGRAAWPTSPGSARLRLSASTAGRPTAGSGAAARRLRLPRPGCRRLRSLRRGCQLGAAAVAASRRRLCAASRGSAFGSLLGLDGAARSPAARARRLRGASPQAPLAPRGARLLRAAGLRGSAPSWPPP